MKNRPLLLAGTLGTFGLLPSLVACSSHGEEAQGSAASYSEGDCLTVTNPSNNTPWDIPICNSSRGNFKTTFLKFSGGDLQRGIEMMGLPKTEPLPDGAGDWWQTFERVQMNGYLAGGGCYEGNGACISLLGRWDIERQGHTIGSEPVDCDDPSFAPRENVRCMPQDFLADGYYKNGEREFYGLMLSRVIDDCPLYPGNQIGQCFWTERAKVGRLPGGKWIGELLGNKRLELEGGPNPGAPDWSGPAFNPVVYPPNAVVTPTTVYLPKEKVHGNYFPRAGAVFVCEDGNDPVLLDQIRSIANGQLRGPVSVVVQMDSGGWDVRRANPPVPWSDNYCTKGWQFWTQYNDGIEPASSFDFLRDVDISGAFVGGFQNDKLECTGGFNLDGLKLDVQNFKIVDGKLQRPSVKIGLTGDAAAGAKLGCTMKKTLPEMKVWAGGVPVVFQISLGLGVEIKVSAPTHFKATLGTDERSISTDNNAEFEIVPSLQLGVTFYKVIGTYVGVEVPFTISHPSNCARPKYEYSLTMKAGAGLALDLPFTQGLQAEWSDELVKPQLLNDPGCY